MKPLQLLCAITFQAVLIHCGISEELHSEVYAILSDTKSDGLHRLQTQTRLCSLSLTDSVVEALYSYVQVEKPFNDAASLLRKITKSTSVAGSLAKKALHEMEAILKHAKVMGCKLEVSAHLLYLLILIAIHCLEPLSSWNEVREYAHTLIELLSL